MGSTANSMVYFGGIPSAPDVNKLMQRYERDKLVTGFKIPYSEISEEIGVDIRSSRFDTITGVWRKKVEKSYNIMIYPTKEKSLKENKSFVVLSEGEKVIASVDKRKSAVSQVRRSIIITTLVNRKELTEEELKTHDYNVHTAQSMLSVTQLRGQAQLPEIGGNENGTI